MTRMDEEDLRRMMREEIALDEMRKIKDEQRKRAGAIEKHHGIEPIFVGVDLAREESRSASRTFPTVADPAKGYP